MCDRILFMPLMLLFLRRLLWRQVMMILVEDVLVLLVLDVCPRLTASPITVRVYLATAANSVT